ncbi:MAG: C25 family cysteine peptidase, partial [bacterium]
MRRIVFYTVIVVFVLMASGHAELVFDVPVGGSDYTLETFDEYVRLRAQKTTIPFAPGSPELPAFSYTYLLPIGKKLKSIDIIEEEWVRIPGNFNIYPKQQELVITQVREFIEPDRSVYGSNRVFPDNIITSIHSGNSRGYQLAQIAVVPFRYFPKSQELFELKKLVVSFELEDCEPGISPDRQTTIAQEATTQFICQTVVNDRSVNDIDKKPVYYIDDNKCDLSPTDLPSLLGAPVDLLIVTTNNQFDGYNDLAHFKKMLGYNTAIRSLTWVRQHYSGIDDAEKIRSFIADAVNYWGVVYVLIGSDVAHIPTRWVWTAPLYSQWPVHIVTDHYYSDLDGNWNKDGDEKYGEVDDSLDLYPDVFIGRLPTFSNDQVYDYINKVREYTLPTNIGHQIKALFFTSDYDISNDAYQMALRLSDHLPAYFMKSFLNEKPLTELRDSINSGFGFVFGLGHGDINNIRVRNNPRENATNYFFDSLGNTDQYALMLVITCYTNTFHADCVSKHWLLNPQGGGVAYIGPTSFSEAYLHEEYTSVQIDSFFVCPLAASLARSKMPYISQSQWDNWYRLYQFSIALLGDPTISLWDSIPMQFNSIAFNPDTVHVGFDSVNININPDIGYNIVLYKEGECFVRDSISGGVLTVGVRTESAGHLKYAVIADGYISYIDSVLVVPVEPCVVFNSCQVVDTLGNADG